MFEKVQVAYELLLPIVEAGGTIQGGSENIEHDTDSAKGLSAGISGMNAMKLLMKTQIIICKRHQDEIGAYKYPAYNMILTCLKLPSEIDINDDCSCLLKAARADFVKTAVELMFQTCLVSPLNAEELVTLGGVSSLSSLLNFYLESYAKNRQEIYLGKNGIAGDHLILEIITNIVRTLSGISYFESGRKAIVELEQPSKFCIDWRRCLDGHYWDDISPMVKKYSLEGIANMAKDHTLQELLVGSGIIWPLVHCLLSYDPTLETISTEHDEQINQMMTQASSNNHAKLATRALGMLCGVMTDDKLKTPNNPKLYALLQNILTTPISKMLRNQRPTELLKTLNVNVETPTRIWNVGMRKELVDFIKVMEKDRDAIGYRSFDKEIDTAKAFSYSALSNEVNIGGVYIRVFTSIGGGKTSLREIENASTFAIELLQYIGQYMQKHTGQSLVLTRDENFLSTREDLYDISDKRFTMAIKALLLLVQMDSLIDDVLCDDNNRAPAILLSLLELPDECEAFSLSSDIITLLSPKQTFADAVARQGELWRLLQVLEQDFSNTIRSDQNNLETNSAVVQSEIDGKKEADQAVASATRQRRGWALLESLTSSTSIANSLIKTSGWLELLGILVGYTKFTKLWSGRQGAAKTLARLLWDPATGAIAAPMLQKFLPSALVSLLKEEGADALLRAFDSECETPELIWDGDMRSELRVAIAEHIESCLRLQKDGKGGCLYNLPPGFQVKYKKLEDELYIGGVYVRLFLKEPTFSLHDPSAFLEMLMQSWTRELEVLTSDKNINELSSKTSLTVAKQDKVELLTSAAVYLCKVRSPLNDKLAQWGYMSLSASFIERSLLKGLKGAPLLSAIRLLHVASSRRSNVEAIAKICDSYGRRGIVLLIQEAIGDKNYIHVDCGFMIECLKKIFMNALGDVSKITQLEKDSNATTIIGNEGNTSASFNMEANPEINSKQDHPNSEGMQPNYNYTSSSNHEIQTNQPNHLGEKSIQYTPAYPHIQSSDSYQNKVNILPAQFNPQINPLHNMVATQPINNTSTTDFNRIMHPGDMTLKGSYHGGNLHSGNVAIDHPLSQFPNLSEKSNSASSPSILKDAFAHQPPGHASYSAAILDPLTTGISPSDEMQTQSNSSPYNIKNINNHVQQSQPIYYQTNIRDGVPPMPNTDGFNTPNNFSASVQNPSSFASNQALVTNGPAQTFNDSTTGDFDAKQVVRETVQAEPIQYTPTPIVGTGIDVRSAPSQNVIAERQSVTLSGAPGCANGRIELLNSALNNELPRFLVENVLTNSSLKQVRDPSGVTAHTVELLKLLTKDPGYGMKFSIILDSLPGWKQFKSQDHSLYITSVEQKVDYFLTDGGLTEKKLLTDGTK